ncbi:MAG: FGGY-family carbohydrate kinase [Halochromatium sp.]
MRQEADRHCWIGLDLGTSGCRALAIDAEGLVLATANTALEAMSATDPDRARNSDAAEQNPHAWWNAVREVLGTLSAKLHDHRPQALCVDGTSAALLLCTPEGEPLTPALMYNDTRAREQARLIAQRAPADSPARGPSASLAKLLWLRQQRQRQPQRQPTPPVLALHQADWISGRLRGRFGDSDWNNALKLGFDPRRLAWPDWLLAMDLSPVRLPRCHAPGADLGAIDPAVAAATGLPSPLRIRAGTTDSTAATLAAGARAPGDAVSSLGSTLVLKLVSEQPVYEAASGVYSHRIGQLWLVGGASNSGGAVLRQYFSDAELERLSQRIDPTQPSGLDYYPLPRPGERFPSADPERAPRIEPRPADDSRFLAGLFEGIARIEQAGYRRLQALGAPAPTRILSTGGGARNPTWSAIRSRVLGLEVASAPQQEAAYGAALLARGDWSCNRI